MSYGDCAIESDERHAALIAAMDTCRVCGKQPELWAEPCGPRDAEVGCPCGYAISYEREHGLTVERACADWKLRECYRLENRRTV